MVSRKKLLLSLVIFLSIMVCWPVLAAQSLTQVKIGVLANRGVDQCLKQWQPTADYLTETIPGLSFEIIPLDYNEVYQTVEKQKVDLVLVNSSFYVEIERWYDANRIATMKTSYMGMAFKKYGGVIFWRKDRKEIRYLDDIRGKKFMTTNESSMAWRAIWRELKERGIDPYRHLNIDFAGTHDKVVYAILGGKADVGGTRTGILERMQAEGKIRLEDFTVIENLTGETSELPFVCSTREYPEWPIAKLAETPDELAEKVAAALVRLPSDAPAAVKAEIAGWTIPLNYQPVKECLRYLKLGPYKDLGKITLKDVIFNYWRWILFAVIAFFSMIAFTGVILRLNSHLKRSKRMLQEEIEEHHKTFEALKAAKELADQASRAKSEFLANMSHEIRTPMSGVIAAAELAMNESLPSQAEHYLKIIFSSANSLLHLINDILDFSKIEVNQFSLEQKPFMLDEIVERVVNLFFNSAAIKHIEIQTDIDPQIPQALVGDPMRFQQILTNLVGNAVKFTDKGNILIGAKALEVSTKAVELEMWVKDTGVGISPDFMDNLFEPFTQADASDTRRYEGSGMGLSLCKRLVEMMDGKIWVESQPGKGSTFSFTAKLKRQTTGPTEKVQREKEEDTIVTKTPDIMKLKAIKADLKKLSEGLRLFDPQKVSEQMQKLKGCISPEAFNRLTSLVELYDYEEAGEIVSGLLKNSETGEKQD
jgi:signal transduction histidine kinase